MSVVSDLHVAYMRSLLLGDLERHEEITRRMQREDAQSRKTLELYVSAVFERLVRHHFGAEATHGDVVRFVARARTTGVFKSEDVDVRFLEQLLTAYVRGDQGALDDMDPSQFTIAMTGLLIELCPYPSDEAAVDELLAEAGERVAAMPAESATTND